VHSPLLSVSQSQSHFTAYSQYVLGSSPLSGHLTRYCFLFKSLGLEFVVLSLWGALSDGRLGLFFVSQSLVICLCVHLLLTFLCFTHLSYKCVKRKNTYALYTTYNTYKVSFSPGSVQHIYALLLTSSSRHNGSLDTWMVVNMTAYKFKPIIFPVSGFTLSNIANLFSRFLWTELKCKVTLTRRLTDCSD
jgi:hypothetical protein